MRKNIQNKSGKTAKAVSAKQTTTSSRMAAHASIRQNLEKHEAKLKDFVSCFTEMAEYMNCVELFRDEYAERLEASGLESFSDEELLNFLESVQDFQGYSQYWGEALKPLTKISN